MLDDPNVRGPHGAATIVGAANTSPLPVLQAGGFGVPVDAYAWEPDTESSLPKLHLWLISLLGSQQAVKALWAQLITAACTTVDGFVKL
jgi:hypothetical protein